MLSICLLGEPKLTLEGEALKIPRRQSRGLLYFLAAKNQAVSRQALLDLLWPDLSRPQALQTLRTILHGIKKPLGGALIVGDQVIGLSDEVYVDVVDFSSRIDASAGDSQALAAALALYRGDFLTGFYLPDNRAYEDWQIYTREHLRHKAVNGYSALAMDLVHKGDYRASLQYLDLALSFNPLQEDLQRERIRVHYIAGDRAGAIQRYDELRKLLDEELGVPPMIETRALYDAIITDRYTLPASEKSGGKPHGVREKPKPEEEFPFLGRIDELIQLEQAVKEKKLVMVEGEAGVGKTRLVEEYLIKSGALGLRGAGRELEHHLPYQPLQEALRSLLLKPDGYAILEEVKQKMAPIWLVEASRLLPELNPTGEVQAPPALPADEARLWEGVRQYLLTLAGSRRLLIFLDDLQWADASTLGLLAYLVRQVDSGKIILIAASREIQPGTPLRTFIHGLTREARLFRLPLQRLRPTDIQKLAATLSPQFAPPLAEYLTRTSEGNAFILIELIRHARQRGILRDDGVTDLSGLSSDAAMPQTVYSLLQSRLDPLTDAARRVLDAAVAAGRDFQFNIVRMVSGLSEQAALDALDELVSAGLVRQKGGLDFIVDHPLIIEVAYQEVGELRHRILHRKVAEAMESLHREALDSYAGAIAWHFFEAGELSRASYFAQLAARYMVSLAAWSEAIEFFQLALKDPAVDSPIALLTGMAEAYTKTGQFELSSQTYKKALDMAGKSAEMIDEITRLRLGLARSLLPQARFSDVILIAQELSQGSRIEDRIAAQLLWGTCLSLEGADLQTAQFHLEKACELWHTHDGKDFSNLAQIEFEQGSVDAQLGDLENAINHYRNSLSAARKSKLPYAREQVVLAHNNLAYHLLLSGDKQAEKEALSGLKVAQESGILGVQPYLYSTLGEIALAADHDGAAEAYFREGLELAERFNIQERVAGITANLGLVAARRSDHNAALQHLAAALEQAESLGTHHLVAQICIWLAPMLPPDQARGRLAKARSIAERSGRRLLLEEVEKLEKELSM